MSFHRQRLFKESARFTSSNPKQNNKPIPKDIDYKSIAGLSNEVVEKLLRSEPETIGSAARMMWETGLGVGNDVLLLAV